MAHPRQKLIDEILDQERETRDHSLRQQALDRARSGDTPKTLTPWEWLEWYEAHGVPRSHKAASDTPARPWWRRWFGR